jgi:hypothetical protein
MRKNHLRLPFLSSTSKRPAGSSQFSCSRALTEPLGPARVICNELVARLEDSAIARRAKKGECVRYLDHFVLLQPGINGATIDGVGISMSLARS